MEQVSEGGLIDTSLTLPFAEVPSSLTVFEEGDVLFAKITPCMENGKGALVEGLPTRVAFGSTEFHVLRPYAGADPKFLYYYTFNPSFRAYAAENMTGAAGQKRVSSRFLKDTRVFAPPVSEQRLIADFLDASCSAIDGAIAAKLNQMEVLGSIRERHIATTVVRGVAGSAVRRVRCGWFRQVPSGWETRRVKRLVSRMDYGISNRTETSGQYPVLKMGHLQGGEIRFANLDFVDDVAEDLVLREGDILYNRTNSADQVGKAAIFRGGRDEDVTFASYLVRLRTNETADPFFLNYVVNSAGFLEFARKLAIPSVQQSNLNSTRYGRIWVPVPPKPEQHAIVEYLDALCDEIERTVAVIAAQVATLRHYRSSLIHECVTGQRRLTEADLRRVKVHG